MFYHLFLKKNEQSTNDNNLKCILYFIEFLFYLSILFTKLNNLQKKIINFYNNYHKVRNVNEIKLNKLKNHHHH